MQPAQFAMNETTHSCVIPAKAGIQRQWMPAFAGMTTRGRERARLREFFSGGYI